MDAPRNDRTPRAASSEDGPTRGEPGRGETRRVEHRDYTGPPVRGLLAATLLIGFLGIALAKPWGGGPPDTAAPTPPESPAPATRGPAVAEADRTAAPPTGSREPLTLPRLRWQTYLADAMYPWGEWGIRAIAFGPPAGASVVDVSAEFGERWAGADGVLPNGPAVRAQPAHSADAVMALGVTVPPGVVPLGYRIWRLEEMDLPQRVVAERAPLPAGSDALFLPGLVATDLGAWPRGTYELDVLLPDGIVRLVTRVPTGTRLVARSQPMPMGPAPDVARALEGAPGGVFAVSGPEVVSIPVAPGPPLDDFQAWQLAGCDARASSCRVASVRSRTVSAVGVLLGPGEVPGDADLELIAPVARRVRLVPGIIEVDDEAGRRTAIVLRLDSPGPLASGLYRLSLRWRSASGQEMAATWHVEVEPPGA